MKMLPPSSTVTPRGALRAASVADRPSPANAAAPFPATVVIRPEVETLRMRWLKVSAMKRFPAESSAHAPAG